MIDFEKAYEIVDARWAHVLIERADEVALPVKAERHYHAICAEEGRAVEWIGEGADANLYGEVEIARAWADTLVSPSLSRTSFGRLRPYGLALVALTDGEVLEEGGMRRVLAICKRHAMMPRLIVRSGGRHFLVAERLVSDNGGEALFGFEEDRALVALVGPYLDLDAPGVAVPRMPRRIVSLDVPRVHEIKGLPSWKTRALVSKARGKDPADPEEEVFDSFEEADLKAGTIMMPSSEQAAVLIASGRFDGEIRLADGGLYLLKGTETVNFEEKPRFDLAGEVKAMREIRRKSGAVIGLDLTRCRYVLYE